MSSIGMQLERLKSPNKNTRYEACEELRVAESLPQEALTALELATSDQDALVAEAARRAILAHPLPSSSDRAKADSQMSWKPDASHFVWTRTMVATAAVWVVATLVVAAGMARLFGPLGMLIGLLSSSCDAMCYEGLKCGQAFGFLAALVGSALLWTIVMVHSSKSAANVSLHAPEADENSESGDDPVT